MHPKAAALHRSYRVTHNSHTPHESRARAREHFVTHDTDLAETENFDELFLTGAKIFAFEICLENRTNFEDKNSVFPRFI